MYKIIFPSGYSDSDVYLGNIDINVIFETGDVFFGSAFTIESVSTWQASVVVN